MRTHAFLFTIFTLLISLNSLALQKFERVTVTGEKAETLQLQNAYGSEIREKDFKNFNLFHTDHVWDFIPNLNTSGGSNRLRFIQIRGIGERSEFDSVPTNSVGYYYDHIDLSGISGIVSTYDLDSLQILKGPQSHLFGDSSIGGNVIALSDWKDTFDNQDKNQAWTGFGSQSRLRLGAKNQTNLNQNFSFKIGVQKETSNGYFRNSFLKKNTSSRSELFITAGTRYIAKNIDLRTSHIHANQNNGYDVWSTTLDKFQTRSDRPGKDEQNTWGHSVELTTALSKKSKFTFISSISESDILYSFDEDWGNDVFWNQVAAWNTDYDYSKIYDRDRKHFHTKGIYQKIISGGFLNLGLHYTNRIDNSVITSFNDGAQRKRLKSRFDSKHYAYFVGLNKKLSKNLKLSINARLERQIIEYSDSNSFIGSPHSNLFGFSTSLNRKIKNHNLVLTLSRGFKGAGFNPELSLSRDKQFYSPESLLNHELTWLFARPSLSTKITVFYMDRDNQQIQTSSQDNPNDPSDFTVFIDNAAHTENYGIEAEASLFKNRKINLDLSAGLLEAKFKTYQLEGLDFSGRSLAHAPLYSFAVMTTYNASKKLSLNLSLTGRDEFYFSNSHNQKSSSYALLGAGVQYKPYRGTIISIWGRNLLNKTYALRGFYFGNEPPNFETNLYTQPGAPMEFGLELDVVF